MVYTQISKMTGIFNKLNKEENFTEEDIVTEDIPDGWDNAVTSNESATKSAIEKAKKESLMTKRILAGIGAFVSLIFIPIGYYGFNLEMRSSPGLAQLPLAFLGFCLAVFLLEVEALLDDDEAKAACPATSDAAESLGWITTGLIALCWFFTLSDILIMAIQYPWSKKQVEVESTERLVDAD